MNGAVDVATGAMGCLLPKLRELLEVYNQQLRRIEQDMAVLESELSRMYDGGAAGRGAHQQLG